MTRCPTWKMSWTFHSRSACWKVKRRATTSQ